MQKLQFYMMSLHNPGTEVPVVLKYRGTTAGTEVPVLQLDVLRGLESNHIIFLHLQTTRKNTKNEDRENQVNEYDSRWIDDREIIALL